MSRIFPPCNSNAPQDHWPAPPVSDARHQGPPCLRIFRPCNPEIFLRRVPRARSETLPSPSLHLLNDLLQFLRHGWNGLVRQLHLSVGSFSCHDIEFSGLLILGGKVITEVSAATLFPIHSRSRNDFRYCQQIVQVEGSVPASVVFAISV